MREAEAFLASRGGHDPTALPALAYQFGLSREEYQQAVDVLYSHPKPQPEPPPVPHHPVEAEFPELLADEEPTTAEVLEEEPLVEALTTAESEFPEIRPSDLCSFVQQARIILSDEHGWTERAVARVNFVADQLLIPHNVRGDLFARLGDRDFQPRPQEDVRPAEHLHTAEVEPPPQPKPKRRPTPSKTFKHYLRKALEAMPAKRVNERREMKLIQEGTTKLGLSEVLARDLLLEVAQQEGYIVASAIEKPVEEEEIRAKEETITTFQQRAATIIAGQGGVNSLTRIMIAQVAEELGLTPEQRDEALSSIQRQTEKNQSDERLQHRATSYQQFLHEKLEHVKHGIVIATLAQKFVQLGVDMHGLPQDLAWKTLRETLQEEELRLITVEQAESHINSLVDDLMLEEHYVSMQNRQRLLAEGDQWGLDDRKCQQLIESRILENARNANRGQRRAALVFGAFFSLLLFGGGYLIYLRSVPPNADPSVARSAQNQPGNGTNQPGLDPTEPENKPEKLVWTRQPWWSESLSLDLIQVYQNETALQPKLTAICTPDLQKRIAAYQTLLPPLITTAVARDGKEKEVIRKSIMGLVQDEPDDEAVAVIAQSLTDDIALKDAPISGATPVSQMLEKAYEAINAAQQPGLPEARKLMLQSRLEKELGISYAGSAPPVELTMSEMIRDLYRKLRDLSTTDANTAARLHANLSATAQNYLPADQVIAKDSNLVAEIVARMTDQWDVYEPVVRRVINSDKVEMLLPILDAYEQKLKSHGIQEKVTALLSRRIGRGLDADDPVQSAAMIRTQLGIDTQIARDGEMYRTFLRRSGSYTWDVPDTASPAEMAIEAAQLGYVSVLGHAATQGELGQRIFESTIQNGPPDLELDQSVSAGPMPTRQAAALSNIELLIQRIQRATNPIGRVDIYKDLCSISGEVDDIDYPAADQLVDYILRPKQRAEQSQIQNGLRAFSHWPTVKLAMADQIPKARRAVDDIELIVNSMLGQTVPIDSYHTARDDLREALLKNVLEEMGGEPARSNMLSPQLANDVAQSLGDSYRLHAQLCGIPADQLPSTQSPEEVASRLIEIEKNRLHSLKLTDAETVQLNDLSRREIALDYLSNSPISGMVARQRIWLRLLAMRHGKDVPQLQSRLQQIVDQLDQQDAQATSVMAQLRSGEMALVKFWELTGGSA